MRLTQREVENFILYLDELLQSEQVHSMKNYIQHGKTSTFNHSLLVAYYSYKISLRLSIPMDLRSITRGAFLHDFYLYDWHIPDKSHRLHGFTHPACALRNATELFQLNTTEQVIIQSHMWPLTFTKFPRKKEAFLVCIVDKLCSLSETFHIPMQTHDYLKLLSLMDEPSSSQVLLSQQK